ncbi:MAG: DUF3800 domain-containing protein [Lachnospiraceae bacterium]|nr:DUF3800 domain-containing protein [Lachnospiraceae bacterium]
MKSIGTSMHEDLSLFIDESGSITKTNISFNRYFIIAILFTRKYSRLQRYFQKGIASLLQNPKYKIMLEENGEIKGSKLSETKKKPIYDRIIRNCSEDFELGIIVLDNTYTTDEFIKNHARTFNYILQLYLDNMFRHCSKYSKNTRDMRILIDEQNISTDAKYTLDDYLEQHFTVMNPLCRTVDVKYTDSKNHPMIQLIDFISNTFYRNLEKHDKTSIETVKMLLPYVCGGKIFDFSTNHDTRLMLDE